MLHRDLQQRTPEWHAIRLGKVTGSRVKDVIRRAKSGPSATRENLKATLICERLTGDPEATYQSKAMAWGTEYEDEARKRYQIENMSLVETVGFATHDSIDWAGASPDGIVDNGKGIVEIKAPLAKTHIAYYMSRKVPPEYLLQIAWLFACVPTARWADFISYCPKLPDEMQYLQIRVKRDNKLVAELEDQVKVFLEEVDRKLAELKAMAKKQS